MGVDWRAIGGLVGSLLAVLSLTLLVPAALALYDGDALAPFLVPFAGGLAVGLGPAPPRRRGAARCARTTASSRWRSCGSPPPCSPRSRT